MDFWEKMRDSFDKGMNSSQGWLDKARRSARDLGEQGVLRVDVMQLESEVNKLKSRLGAQTYELLVEKGQSTVSKNTSGIKDLLAEISDLEERIDRKKEALRRAGEEPPSGEQTGR